MQKNFEALESVFSTLPGINALLLPNPPLFTIVALTDDYVRSSGRAAKEMIGRGLFEAFPSFPEDVHQRSENSLRTSLEFALRHKEVHCLPMQRYDIPRADGGFEERYWVATNNPVLNKDGEVIYVVHHAEDVTSKIKAAHREQQMEYIEKTYSLFMQAPVVLSIIKGENKIVEMANEGALKLWGKTGDIIGKPLEEAVPEIKGQGIIELLEKVRKTGVPYAAKEEPVVSYANGKKKIHYFDRVYQPYYEGHSASATGVFTMSHDVTALVLARRRAEESEAKYRSLFDAMDQGFCVLEMIFDHGNLPVDYRFLEVNPVFESQTGLKNAVGKTARQLIPDLEHHWFEAYGKVAQTGEPIRFMEGSEAMGRWFDVFAFRVGGNGSHKVALLFTDITERKRGEEAIRESERNLRSIILHAPVAMCIFRGPSFIVEIANDRMFALWDKSAAQMIGKPVFEGLPEARNQGLEPLLEKVYTTGATVTANERPVVFPRNGKMATTYLNFVYEPFRNGQGVITGVMAVAIDVTDQVTARMKVEEANKELRFVTDTMPQLVWATEPDGFSFFFNKGWLEYTGLTFEQVQGDGWTQSLHPDDAGPTFDAWRRAVRWGDVYDVAYRLRRHDGVYRWFVARGIPMRDDAGNILKWYGTSTDIHDQKLTEEALKQSTERFDLVAKATHDAVWDWNLLTDEIWWNEGFKELFGYKAEDIEPTIESWYNRVHPDDKERVIGGIHQVIDNGGANWSAEYRFRKKDGSYVVVFDRGYALHNKEGKPYRMLGSMQDVTERKEWEMLLEQRVRERTAELERRNKELEQFAYVSHHDLQEPLRKIMIFADMIRDEAAEKLSEVSRNRLERVITAARRMSAVLRDVLSYASLEKKEQFRTVDLAEVLAMVQADLELLIAEKKGKIIANNLPSVNALPEQMHQLFYNLLNNALKFTKPDVQPVISIVCKAFDPEQKSAHPELDQNRNYYHIAFRDNGIGFSPSAAERIFAMFQRLHSKEAYEGTGIGLALCKKVVVNHGGKIWAEGEDSAGATFHVLLPIS